MTGLLTLTSIKSSGVRQSKILKVPFHREKVKAFCQLQFTTALLYVFLQIKKNIICIDLHILMATSANSFAFKTCCTFFVDTELCPYNQFYQFHFTLAQVNLGILFKTIQMFLSDDHIRCLFSSFTFFPFSLEHYHKITTSRRLPRY